MAHRCVGGHGFQYLDGKVIDFMKVDTNGHELEVLCGHDFARHGVRVVLAVATPGRRVLRAFGQSGNQAVAQRNVT